MHAPEFAAVVDDAVAAGANGVPVTELRALRKTYFKPDGSVMVEALRGVDLVIRRGEYVAIMGASGSGKSTLMNVLGCLDRPTQGEYLLDGRSINAMDDETLSRYRGRTIGFIFQAFNLIPEETVLENVGVPLFYQGVSRRERVERATQMLGLVGLGDRLDHRPRELSGGQQQRVAIARALVTRPIVLLADEPTGNLDSTTGQAVLAMFDDLNAKGITIIIVTHDPGVAERCRRVVRMKDGVVEYDRTTRGAGLATHAAEASA
ncbi:MAG: ABC transporter ATP-binding protein [Phycisphaerales bacterium]|nr:ABC transporter ATP-binding protein [Phycisphaerales bacterium]